MDEKDKDDDNNTIPTIIIIKMMALMLVRMLSIITTMIMIISYPIMMLLLLLLVGSNIPAHFQTPPLIRFCNDFSLISILAPSVFTVFYCFSYIFRVSSLFSNRFTFFVSLLLRIFFPIVSILIGSC